jgi:site-specific DNA-methyltransferase (adenine-specific)
LEGAIRMEIIYKKVEDLIPYVNNTRTHSKEQVSQIASSIKEFGFTNPVLIDEENGVIAGHGRIMGAKLLKIQEVPTICLNGLSEAQRKAYIIADNKIALNAGWDEELLKLELQNLKDMDFDLSLIGFSDEELAEFKIEDDLIILDTDKADDVPEVVENPVIKLGDLIELGHNYQHRLLCGDSTSEDDVARLIGKDKIDFIHTDPPYGINLDGDNSNRGSNTSLMAGGLKLKSFKDDTIDYAVKAMNIIEPYKIKKQVWWGANYYAHHFPQTNNWLVWDKRVEEKMRNTNSDCELAYVIDGHNSVRIFRHLWNGLIKASEKQDKRVHPTQKPYALTEYCIAEYAPETKIVLDLFTGSGSTFIGCENMNKSFRGMEFEQHYAQVIIQRYVDYTSNPKIKINGVEVDWEDYKASVRND